MSISIFEFDDYRTYLDQVLSQGGRRGKRAELARFLKCQNSFISQVLTDRAHLSLEHAIAVSEFLQHSSEEQRFFLLLVQKAKAGNKRLERFFEDQIEEIRTNRETIKDNIDVREELSAEDQATYYSMWWYSAIHILSALPGLNSRDSIINRLGLSASIVDQCLAFLIKKNLVEANGGTLSIGKGRIHLGSRSHLISRHHSNWRQKVIQVFEEGSAMNAKHLHYSGVLGLSRKDADQIRRIFLESIKKGEEILQKSSEEVPYCLLLDWFQL